jgi:NitT/TauT family transport system substrate-binding protein
MHTRSFYALAAAVTMMLAGPAIAKQIVITNYPIGANGFPYAVALQMGFFKQAGADVTGILSASGGGTTVRDLLGGDLAYGDADIGSVVEAVAQGAPIKVVAGTNNSTAELVLVVRHGSGIKKIADLKGKKIGYTQPHSTTQAVEMLILHTAGLTPNDVEMIRTGGIGQSAVAMQHGLIDAALLTEPLWSEDQDKFDLIGPAVDFIPVLAENVGVTTVAAAKNDAAFIRGVIAGRRMAVDFMREHPKEAAAIIATVLSLKPEYAESAIDHIQAISERMKVPYWSPGNLDLPALQAMVKAQISVGALKSQPDWSTLIDESFLPPDLRRGNAP